MIRFLSDDIKTKDIINDRLKEENEILLIKNNKIIYINYSLKKKK